jgi:hypothetical protein
MKTRKALITEATIYFGKLLLGLALSTLAWFALPAAHGARPGPTAAETAQHKVRMDDSQDLKDDLREAIEKSNARAAKEASAKLAALAREEEQYWAKTKLETAIGLAHDAVAAADRMLQTSPSPGAPEARQAFASLEVNCRSCHDLHPEKQRDLNLTAKDEGK